LRKPCGRNGYAAATGRLTKDQEAPLSGVIPVIQCDILTVLRGRYMDAKLVQCDPSIMMGKPVIAGTRVSVELILEKLAA